MSSNDILSAAHTHCCPCDPCGWATMALPAACCLSEDHSCSGVGSTSTAIDTGTGVVPISTLLRDGGADLQRPAFQLVLALDVPVSENYS